MHMHRHQGSLWATMVRFELYPDSLELLSPTDKVVQQAGLNHTKQSLILNLLGVKEKPDHHAYVYLLSR